MSDSDFDCIIIGGGSAGYAAARTTATAGLRTAVIEGGSEMGGLCILRGCMPTKALLYAAEVLHLAQRSSIWGLRTGEVSCDWEAVIRRKDLMVEEFASYRRQQLTSGRFELFRGQARFVSPHVVEMSDGRRFHGRSLMIATGSVCSDPPVPALRDVGVITSDDALSLKVLPKSLIVLGGGAVAVEFAQLFQRMGVQVTLIQRSSQILKDFDQDAALAVESALSKDGMVIHKDTRILSAGREGDARYVEFEQGGQRRRVIANEILHALGRSPNTQGLGLDVAGVKTDHGRIVTSSTMQTSSPHIFAGGDCASPYELVHLAVIQGEIAGWNIANPDKLPREMDYRLLTSVVFSDPQCAVVGLTEKAAAAAGRKVRVAAYPFSDHGKSIIMDSMIGFVKLIVDEDSREILGGACVGPSAGELIHEIVVAMAKRMTAAELAAVPHYHPTLAEIWTYPAEELA
ncbi:MAG: NAD(P)/FAD-dependent oxidoreductase [Verrucomicrobia bacterium]|nr:NAD(P)/FAD-dependent oxidoreductase [Verrucomicrobiota bacterium]